MKQIFLLLALLNATQTVAQDYEYVPFVREGVKWVCYYENLGFYTYVDRYYPSGKTFFELEIKGDTVINGKQYKAMHKYSSGGINSENDTIPIYLREENKIVYGLVTETYLGLLIGYGPEYGAPDSSIYDLIRNREEFVLYNFDNPKNHYEDLFYRNVEDGRFGFLSTDTILLADNRSVKRNIFKYQVFEENIYIIEGIGYDGEYVRGEGGYTLGYLFNVLPGPTYRLSHVIEDGKIVYKGTGYDPDTHVGIDEEVADLSARPLDPNYYNLMGQPVGKDVPTIPGIYIHQGKKILIGN